MRRPRSPLCIVAASLLWACVTDPGASSPAPGPSASPSPAVPVPTASALGPSASFDPATISAEEKKETLISVADLILELNRITRERNFEAWQSYLMPAFKEKYADPEYLAEISRSYLLLRVKKIVLKTLKDYFDYVVYPSHQNDRVDDIEFIGHNRVKAVYYNDKNERRVLWDLEKADGAWKISVESGLGI